MYRIAQEALTNVAKHAHARHVRVELEEQDGGILVRIADDGAGFSPTERARALPGHIGVS
ncbi:MAG: ATP-binding protein [Actinomycetota bacterium]